MRLQQYFIVVFMRQAMRCEMVVVIAYESFHNQNAMDNQRVFYSEMTNMTTFPFIFFFFVNVKNERKKKEIRMS